MKLEINISLGKGDVIISSNSNYKGESDGTIDITLHGWLGKKTFNLSLKGITERE